MDTDKKLEVLKNYYCMFKGNPTKCTPYAIFATLPDAFNNIRRLKVDGPLVFSEWLKDYQPPESISPDKPLWKD